MFLNFSCFCIFSISSENGNLLLIIFIEASILSYNSIYLVLCRPLEQLHRYIHTYWHDYEHSNFHSSVYIQPGLYSFKLHFCSTCLIHFAHRFGLVELEDKRRKNWELDFSLIFCFFLSFLYVFKLSQIKFLIEMNIFFFNLFNYSFFICFFIYFKTMNNISSVWFFIGHIMQTFVDLL